MSERLRLFIERALAALSAKLSAHLGDRTTYIGASDVTGCPRKAALSRLQPEKKAFSIANQIAMTLGHAFEDIVGRIFDAGGAKVTREKELSHPAFPWLKCHVDFWAETTKEVRLRELKSTKGLPSHPFDTWDDQVTLQYGLAALNNPDKTVAASIMVIDRIACGIKEFNDFVFNPIRFEYLVSKAQSIWDAFKNSGPVPGPEPGPFCGSCSYRGECPVHAIDHLPVVPDKVADLMSEFFVLNERQKQLESEASAIKEHLLLYSGPKFRAVTDGGSLLLTVRTQKGRDTIDTKKLASLYPEAHTACLRTGEPSVVLSVAASGASGGDA